MKTAIVTLENVRRTFRGTTVIERADAAFTRGTAHAIIGPNGSGKTVLLRLITGLIRPDEGAVRWGAPIADRGRYIPGRIGAVIDRPAYLPFASGLDNLRDLARILGEIDDDAVRAAMDAVGLDHSLRTHVRSYSLGMKQKLGIAQAIMEAPDLLVLDEPFNALDTASVDRMRDLLSSKVAAGTTLIFTSHNEADVRALATQRWAVEDRILRAV